jgi:GT2 family glycosyltransferase
MVAESQTLSVHLALHTRPRSVLVAGARRPWEPACRTTFDRVMQCAHPERDQFRNKAPSFQEVFSSNLSIEAQDFWRLDGFDESLWAFEDIDLAYRAQQAGQRLVFSREALGYHNHPMTFDQACAHQRHYQRHAAAFLRKHPDLQGRIEHLVDKTPLVVGRDAPSLVVRKVARRVIASRAILRPLEATIRLFERFWPNPGILRFLYWKALASYQLIGYREGLQEVTRSVAEW